MEYQCSVCGQRIKRDLLVYVNHTQTHIIDEIRASHPEWEEKDGLCQKCIEYFRSQMQGRPSRE